MSKVDSPKLQYSVLVPVLKLVASDRRHSFEGIRTDLDMTAIRPCSGSAMALAMSRAHDAKSQEQWPRPVSAFDMSHTAFAPKFPCLFFKFEWHLKVSFRTVHTVLFILPTMKGAEKKSTSSLLGPRLGKNIAMTIMMMMMMMMMNMVIKHVHIWRAIERCSYEILC